MTHNISLVSTIADRVIVMESGNIVEAGTVEEVIKRPRHPTTVQLIADTPTLNSEPSTPAGKGGLAQTRTSTEALS